MAPRKPDYLPKAVLARWELRLRHVNLEGGYIQSIPLRDGFDLLAVQGTLNSLLQHHSSKAVILRCSAFFMVHLSYL